MRSWLAISLFGACAFGALSQCNLHSGSGEDPNAVTNPEAGSEDGSTPDDAKMAFDGAGSGGSSGGNLSGTTSGSGGGSGGGGGSGSGGGVPADGAAAPDVGTGNKCSGSSGGGGCTVTGAQLQACHQMNDGGTAGRQACISCVQNACPGGAQDFDMYTQSCACAGGPCTGPCSGANDLCTIGSCDPNKGCSAACVSCLQQVESSGATCDPTGPQVAPCCNADPSCMRYEMAITTFCP
jgi:hypothetical protein